MAFSFDYYTPTEMIFGKNAEARTGELAKKYGAGKVLLHYGGQSAVRSGLLDRVKAALETAGVAWVELGGVVPNPHLGKVYEGIELGKRENVDFLLAVGGGSVIDSAKAIAYGLAEPEFDVWELYTHTREPKKCLPVGTVLTIAAAGSEMSMGSVITNEVTGEKRACDYDICRPRFSILNPELTMTLPDYQTQSGCADMMMHIMERYFGQGGNMEVTDGIAESLLRTIMKNAEILHRDPMNYDARAEIMWAGSLAHNGLTGCGSDGGDWACHMIEHELGGMFDVTHGAGLAAVWSAWAKYVCKELPGRFAKFAVHVMGVEPCAEQMQTIAAGIEAMDAFYHRIGMPVGLKELGIAPTDEQIEAMAASCIRAGGGSVGSAKVLKQEDVANIYRMAR